ncbi:hypothetical protein SARC_03016 [Sphaeroforma arctica JP610]|uniref:F-box domain-containing protein n=1 Tax=Sphaeroforma arctica JP610 TaxID=667725 RepID=A0A0L0G777_9EUKA|nr:hypothetical protein SARC_03016 [Sphaeroforma arctica JP610]KNC84774.1 hypothetical protein SARC_03016 [Sphaeroforma arctica JP610]|eukprot:XP_014158676.1 hypothetical protein SARC_03016 [Sphaeroforma arctica JP610]
MTTFEIAGVSIPTELLVRIFSELDRDTLRACKLVCKYFNIVANDPFLYTRLPLALTASEVLCDRTRSDYVMSRLSRYPYLEEFYLPSGLDSGEGLEALLRLAPKLSRVNLRYIDADRWKGKEIKHFLESLVEVLPIRKISVPVSMDAYTFLHVIDVFHTESFIPSTIQSESLRELYAADTPSTAQLLQGCPNIQKLILAYARLEEPLYSDSLRTLEVSEVHVKDAILNCSVLTSLSVDFVDNWGNLATKNLKSLTLHDDGDYDPPIDLEDLPKLQHLSVNFITQPLASEQLVSLTLRQRGVSEGLMGTPNLKTLSLQTSIPTSIPAGLHTLVLDNLSFFPPEPSFFDTELPNRLHRLTTLHYRDTVRTVIASPALEILRVNRFFTHHELVATVRACPCLRKIYLLHGRPWERESNTMEAKNRQWGDFAVLEELPSVFIPLDLSRTQGPVFSDLLLAGKVSYFG